MHWTQAERKGLAALKYRRYEDDGHDVLVAASEEIEAMKMRAGDAPCNPDSRLEGTEGATRPSLDAFVASVCSAIRVRGNLGRKLPIRDTSADAEAQRFQMAVVR